MGFEPGSNLAQRLEAFYRDTPLEKVVLQESVPAVNMQESLDRLAGAILPAPPVVSNTNMMTTGVFKLPAMPLLDLEDIEDSPGSYPLESEDFTLDPAEDEPPAEEQEMEIDDIGMQVEDDEAELENTHEALAEGSWLKRVPLPALPDFEQSQNKTEVADSQVILNAQPIVVNTRGASWKGAFLVASFTLGLVLVALSYRTTLAELRVDDVMIPPPSREQLALEGWAKALDAIGNRNGRLTGELVAEVLLIEPKYPHAQRLLALGALVAGDRALALRHYRTYRRELPPSPEESDTPTALEHDAITLEKFLQDAANFVAFKDATRELKDDVTDWNLVARQLVTHTAE